MPKRPALRPRARAFALEPRILFDAAAASAADDFSTHAFDLPSGSAATAEGAATALNRGEAAAPSGAVTDTQVRRDTGGTASGVSGIFVHAG